MAIICVKLEDERHAALKQTGNLYVLERIFGEALEAGNFLWLAQIDPYGDTVFNRIQVTAFLEEWHRLSRYVQSDAETVAHGRKSDALVKSVWRPTAQVPAFLW